MVSTSTPTTWVLPATGTGDNRQLLCLAEALGWPFELKPGPDAVLRVIGERLASPFSTALSRDKRGRYGPPWPDLVLFSGGRPVVDAWRIRDASGGNARLVCVGRPWAPLARFDLVVTTPQYRLPARANVLENMTPLNPISRGLRERAAVAWAPRFTHLPRPWLGLLVGGDSGSYRFTPESARRLAALARDHVRRSGGAVLVSTSARTPASAAAALEAEFAQPKPVPHFSYAWQPDDPANPLAALLGLADQFLVTGDSVAMVADACATGRPVAVFDPPRRLRARLMTRRRAGASSTHAAWTAWRDRLVARGLWFPRRDLGRYHRMLREAGLVVPIEALGSVEGSASAWEAAGGSRALDDTLARVRNLFPGVTSATPPATVGHPRESTGRRPAASAPEPGDRHP